MRGYRYESIKENYQSLIIAVSCTGPWISRSGYLNEPSYTGSLGEGYSILNTILQDTVRIYCEPDYLYDSMIFVYECTPLNLLAFR